MVPYESDEVTRLIVDRHDRRAFSPVAHLTVGDFRDWLLSDHSTGDILASLAPGLTPEMAAAVSKIMRLQDLVTVAAKIRVVTRFRNTIGLRRAAFDAVAAQSSDRRSQGHRRQHHRRPARTAAATR